MRHALIPLALGLGASANSLEKRWEECKFELNAQGGANGCIGQIDDGQCRIGGRYPPATFTLDKHTGILKDSKGRGCIITGSSHQQIQCDDGKAGTPGWTIENGELRHNGCGDFAACPVNDFGEWNIYKYTIKDQLKCVGIHLKGSCGPNPPPPLPKPEWHQPKPEWHPPKPEWHPPKHEEHPPKPEWHHPKPCCHECPKEPEHKCHKSCEKECKPLPPPAPKPCCHECPKEPEHKCHKSCDSKCEPPHHHHEEHHGPPPKVAECLERCHKEDWQCKKNCHGFEIPPPAKIGRPLHPKECKHCEKCKYEDKPCLKKCTKKCEKPTPKPCSECKPFGFKCKLECVPDPKPAPKCCHECEEKDKPCHKSCDKKCLDRRNVEASMECSTCPRDDDHCKSKCHGPKPPPCHTCHKKPDCEKKCWHHFPSPKPAVWCDQCAPWDRDCFKVCIPPKHSPHPKPPVCCTECADWDRECFNTCYPPKGPEWKPKDHLPCHKCPPKAEECKKKCTPHVSEPKHCHKCHPEEHECKKTCKPAPCHKCHPKEPECKKTCKPLPCHKCLPKEHECRKLCKPHRPAPKPLPKCCDECKKAEPKCKESCVSREVLNRMIAEADGSAEVENNVVDASTAVVSDVADAAEVAKESLPESNEETVTNGALANAQLVKRREANRQCRCADGDRKCIAKCVTVEVEKEIVICKDCGKKKGCDEAKKCEPVKPKPCNICHKEPKQETCKKTCYHPPKRVHPPKCCHECHEEDKPCFKKCDKKCKPPTPKPEPPKCCHECKDEEKPCWKKCNECKPKPPPCHECPHKDFKCLESCHLKPQHRHEGPEEHCVKACGEDDWECKKACYFPHKPHGAHNPHPPPPPPLPQPKCCDDCHREDHECKQSCWEKPKPHFHLPPPPPPPPPPPQPKQEWGPPKKECACKEGDWSCWKSCYPPPPPPPPGGNEPPALQHPHAPPPSWAPPSTGKLPGQLYGACPADLHGPHQCPHQIVPISTSEPHRAHGAVSSPLITDTTSTIFNFDIPSSYAGKTCSLFFFFPHHHHVLFSGLGSAGFDLVGKADEHTTCASRPVKHRHLNDIPLRPGTTYWVADHACTPGVVSFEVSGRDGFKLEYSQKDGPEPVGLFVRAC